MNNKCDAKPERQENVMNDFTKEELQIMLLDMNVYIHRTTILTESPSHKALRGKIQSMIDNFCEHYWSPTEALNIPLHCLKCGEKAE